MSHRIFIAINLPENVKKKFLDYQSKWPELPCRWTKKENLHITSAFLGYVNDEELVEICEIAKEVASRHQPFIINLIKIAYGPPKKPPRMIWVGGKESKELGELQRDLENSLLSSAVKILEEPEARPYTPHITLGRLRQWEFRLIEPEERPEVNEEINLSFEVNSLEIMESKLKPTGPDYFVLESLTLGKR